MSGPAPLRPWTACPTCGSERRRQDYDFTAAAAGGAGRSERIPGVVVSCLDCGLQYKIPADPAAPLESYYADQAVYQFRDDEAEAEKEFSRLLGVLHDAGVGAGGKLLDVGSGPGRFLGCAARAGLTPVGVELNSGLAALARAETGAEVLVGDALDLPRLLAGREDSFDAVTLLDVIEHVRDPAALLRSAARFLKPDGVMLIYTPNHAGLLTRVAGALHHISGGRVDGPARGIYDCDHIVFFAPATLRAAARRAGLRDGAMTMIRFNPDRRRIARGPSAMAARLIEACSPWVGGEFRMALTARRSS